MEVELSSEMALIIKTDNVAEKIVLKQLSQMEPRISGTGIKHSGDNTTHTMTIRFVDKTDKRDLAYVEELPNQFFQSRRRVYEYFNMPFAYTIHPICDRRTYYWHLSTDVLGSGEITYANERGSVFNGKVEDCETYEIYYEQGASGQKLPNVFRTAWHTMFLVKDQLANGRVCFALFDNVRRLS